MPELTAEQMSAFEAVFSPLCDALSLSLSENINQAAMFDAPAYSQMAVDAAMEDATPVLQTTFSYPAICADDLLLVFPQDDAGMIADLVGGGDGTNPIASLAEEQMTMVAQAMSGTVQGLGISIGNNLGYPVLPGQCATTLDALTLPPSFANSGSTVIVTIPYQIMDVRNSSLTLYFTQEFVKALAPVEAEAEVESAPEPMVEVAEEVIAPSVIPTPVAAPSPVAAPQPVAVGAGVGVGGGAAAAPAATPAAAFPSFDTPAGDILPRGMDLIMDIPLDVTVELGRKQMLIKEVLDLAAGSIVELERVAGEPVDLMVNGRLVAKGEVVVIEDNFGIRITEIVSPTERLNGLGKRG